MSKPIITVENLGKAFKVGNTSRSLRHLLNQKQKIRSYEKWALKGVTLSIYEGETVGIIGSNGAGKSTLLKLLSRIVYPSEGKINVGASLSPMLEVGTGFYPDLTGKENIYLSGAIMGMSRAYIDEHLEEIIAFAEVGNYIDEPVRSYSTGMYVRLGFSVANFLDYDILAIDEVMAVGDHYFRQKCKELISKRHLQKSKTILLVSHDLQMIEDLCPRTILIEKGRLAYDGNTKEAISRYLEATPSEIEGAFVVSSNGLKISQPILLHNNERYKLPIRSGASLDLRFMLTSTAPIPDLICKCCIRHEKVGAVATVDNLVMGQPLSINKGAQSLACDFTTIPFAEGRYIIDIELRHRNRSLLNARAIKTFEIKGSLLNLTNRTTPHTEGICQLTAKWSIHEG